MSRTPIGGRVALALLFVAGVAACGGGQASPGGPAAPQATITALPITPTREPTSTLAPTVETIAARPEVAEALTMVEQGNYEAAISLLRPIYLRLRDSGDSRQADELRDLQELLARAYLAWGQATVDASGGDLRQISIAYDRFNDGVTIVSSESATRGDLVAERDTAAALIAAAQAHEQLAAGQSADPRAAAEELVAGLAAVRERHADYPGLMPLHYDALVTAARVYEESPGATKDEQVDALSRALEHCQAAAALDPTRDEASACAKRVSSAISRLTATPTPVQRKLRFRVLNYNDDASCFSVQVARISTAGWFFTVDGIRGARGNFDTAGNARVCGLGQGQEVTFTVFDAGGRVVPGGSGVPSKGSAIMGAEWK